VGQKAVERVQRYLREKSQHRGGRERKDRPGKRGPKGGGGGGEESTTYDRHTTSFIRLAETNRPHDRKVVGKPDGEKGRRPTTTIRKVGAGYRVEIGDRRGDPAAT
jgi:hypothetical protein